MWFFKFPRRPSLQPTLQRNPVKRSFGCKGRCFPWHRASFNDMGLIKVKGWVAKRWILSYITFNNRLKVCSLPLTYQYKYRKTFEYKTKFFATYCIKPIFLSTVLQILLGLSASVVFRLAREYLALKETSRLSLRATDQR